MKKQLPHSIHAFITVLATLKVKVYWVIPNVPSVFYLFDILQQRLYTQVGNQENKNKQRNRRKIPRVINVI